ncbi:hypothetical protein EB001_07335 [bacterium]|nr:hypothetical protein [bacterium]
MTDTDFQMFGMSKADIRNQYINSITAKLSGMEMVVMGILSDCQEMQNYGVDTKERIRKQMNIAKFILAEMMQEKRQAA